MDPNQLWHFVPLSPRDNCWAVLWVICLIYKMEMCWFEPLGTSWVKSETGRLHRGQVEAKERGGHSRLVGGRFNNKGTYTWDLSWALQNSRSLYPPSRFSRVYIEALMGFSYVSIWCLLSHSHILELAPQMRRVGRVYIFWLEEDCVIFHCTYVLHLLYTFICQ